MSRPAPTHVITRETDVNGEPNPLLGLQVSVIERSGRDQMGFNAMVVLHATTEELLARMVKAYPETHARTPYTLESVRSFYDALDAGYGSGIAGKASGMPVAPIDLDEVAPLAPGKD